MNSIEKAIGYTFRDRRLLDQALTHSSYAHDRNTESYERLEFLGDSILGWVTADWLYRNTGNMPEGKMTRLRAEHVSEHALYPVAVRLGIGPHLKLSKGEELSGGRSRISILADTIESIIAAIYLDGGIDAARKFIFDNVLDITELNGDEAYNDYKSELQELVQKDADGSVEYNLVSQSGPDHDKRFVFSVSVNGSVMGTGEGRSKKEAEQSAAEEALKTLKA
ncbi:MAG: ribonuclease III [Oscillospiraceae bacterium]|nr:ribonuclease III [Oscillospiraceae bacterium]